jgi:hypothetical protein
VCPHINGKLESPDRTLAEGSPAGQTGITGLSPESVDTPALLHRGNASPLRIECLLRPTGITQHRCRRCYCTHTLPALGRHGIEEFLVRPEGGEFSSKFNNLPRGAKK